MVHLNQSLMSISRIDRHREKFIRPTPRGRPEFVLIHLCLPSFDVDNATCSTF